MTSDDLVAVLTDLGVDVRRSDGREVSGRCPVHLKVTGREDKSPSWSMNASTGLWICFSCGARGTLSTLVSELTGDPDSLMAVHRVIISTGLERASSLKTKAPEPEVDWLQFGKFTRVPSKMLALRNLSDEAAWFLGIRWDIDNKCWVIPISSQMGELKGWQLKKVGWFRNHPEGVKKSESLFGADRFVSDTAVLVESPLDVVRLASVTSNPQGLATYGAAVSETQMKMLSSLAKRVIVAMDNDEAGIASSKRLIKTLPHFRNGIKWFNYSKTSAKDIGEMSNEEIIIGLTTATFMPPWV